MPDLSDKDFLILLEEIKKNAIPLTKSISKETKLKATKECDEYIKNGNIDVNNMIPLSIYYIISKLPEEKQISFIEDNIEFIKANNEDIFLYTMLCPKSLSYFLSFNVLKSIKKIDNHLFKKIISQNYESLLYGFSEEDYYNFYTEFSDDLNEIDNIEFINSLYFHNKHYFDEFKTNKIQDTLELQNNYNKKFFEFILKRYKDKISRFTGYELLRFLQYVEDMEVYKKLVQDNYKKLSISFSDISKYELYECLEELNTNKQEILIHNFFDYIIKKQDIKQIIYRISPNIIIDLYNKNKEVFNHLTLKDWVDLCYNIRVFNEDFKKILDTFEIENIESFFDKKFYASSLYKVDVSALRYIETKYRNNIKTNGTISNIDKKISIFSEIYLKNLSEIKEMFKNNSISKNDEFYKSHLSNFIMYLKNENIINNIEGNNFKEIEKLFYRIVMGQSITILFELSSIEEITIFNRLGTIDFNVQDFTVEQLEKYNVKLHKQLYEKVFPKKCFIKDYKKLILKLMLMVGFNNAKVLLDIDDSLPVLEHLSGNVNVKSIILDEQGNPILNKTIMNLLFSDKNYKRIRGMLFNKDNDLYKYFPRIFNEWELIEMNNKNKSLNNIIDFLKSNEITLLPKYYKLQGLFKFIGCKNTIVDETLILHDEMLKRTTSTIPRICGTENEYSYEILELNNMESLVVGNKTDCCFTVLGNGYSCLKHALTSNNGRVLVIRKDNELIAHSWVWRNGDLLCLDNIEISKKINSVDFLNVYLKIADEITHISLKNEGYKDCIKNVTIGFTNFCKKIDEIENYPCFISKYCSLNNKDFVNRLGKNKKIIDILPQPLEEVRYSDSKNVQYLIKGTGVFNLGMSNFYYQDDRKNIMHYKKNNCYSEDYLNEISKIVNSLRYKNLKNNNDLESYEMTDCKDLDEVYCNDDWYVINYCNGNIESFINSNDLRADVEMQSVLLNNEKILKKQKV